MKEIQWVVKEKNDFEILSNSTLHAILATFQLSFLKNKTKYQKSAPLQRIYM